ncbi:helix-turn-helix domain-containing protein [Carnobacterium maltaromaticum]|uniref:helix-turn-helix domain-containing protein n=1 Tax=Carnobacterium maltaromaticum TaxID=2751 RepID=UPI0039BE6D4E
MNFFFNRRTLRKILAFYFIVENNGNVDLNNVSEYLKCTVRTTKDVLDELENDVKQWDSEVYLQQKSDGYLYVHIPSDLSIHGIYLYYLEDNINFNWMKQYFFENTVEINEYALDHYVSYSTMYKNMKVIDRNILSRYKLQFNTNVNATILGDEKQKRLFFFDFFWYSYSGLKWPFYNVEKKSSISFLSI